MVEASDEHNFDCECSCDGGETYKLFVGDKSLCTKEQCEQKVQECTNANSANFVSCMCVCGDGSHRNLLTAAERASECTEETCANKFSECPIPALETSANENIPVFLDCSCGCQNETNSSDMEYKERLASDGSATKCSTQCKDVMNLTSLGAGEREKIQMMREEEDTEERLHHQQQKRAKTAKNTDTTIERRKSSNGKATTTTSHSSAEPVEIISVFETMQTLRRPEPTIGEVEWISEDLTTTARVKTISRAHPDFTIDLCRKEGQETQALATRRLKEGEKNVAISYTEKDYGSYQYQLRVRRT